MAYMEKAPYAEPNSKMPDTFFFADELDQLTSNSPVSSVPSKPASVPLTQQTVVSGALGLPIGDPARVMEEPASPVVSVPSSDPAHPNSPNVSTSEENKQ